MAEARDKYTRAANERFELQQEVERTKADLAEAKQQVARGARLAEKTRQAGEGLLNVADRMEGLELALAREKARADKAEASTAAWKARAEAEMSAREEDRRFWRAEVAKAEADAAAMREALRLMAHEWTEGSIDGVDRVLFVADASNALLEIAASPGPGYDLAERVTTWRQLEQYVRRTVAGVPEVDRLLAALDEKGE